jgi:ribosomal protein S18 acetylase RimI-like enzyme
MPRLRKAHRHDAKQLADLAKRTFRETFGAQNTAEDMALHCQTSYSESIQDREISSPDMTTFVAEENERFVGFAQVRRGVSPSCIIARSPGEIQRLYVESEWHGKGLARDLMHACIEEMKSRGSDVIWLGVWERNPRAISFYKKFGFVEVGDHVFPLGRDLQRDIIMVRPTVESH